MYSKIAPECGCPTSPVVSYFKGAVAPKLAPGSPATKLALESQVSFEDCRSSLVVGSSSFEVSWDKSRRKNDKGLQDMEIDCIKNVTTDLSA